MLQIIEYKRTKEHVNILFLSENLKNIGKIQVKVGKYEIRVLILFLISILLFSISINIYLKFKNPKNRDIILSFDYYNVTKDIKRYENSLLYRLSSQEKCNLNILDKFLNMNKFKNDNNLEIYKEKKLVFCLSFVINIIIIIIKVTYYHERREEKRREKKRREEKRSEEKRREEKRREEKRNL